MIKKLILVLIVVLSLGLVGCSNSTTEMTTLTTTDSTALYYQDFSDRFIGEKSQQLYMNSGVYYIYMFSYTCSHCEEAQQEVLTKVQSIPTDELYLVAITSLEDVNQAIRDFANDDIFTPSLIKIDNHEVIRIYVGADKIMPVLDDLAK